MSAATAGTTVLPVYLVKGEDAVVVGDAVRTLVDELVGDGDAALTVEDFSSDDYELAAVVDAAQTPPFITDRRVVVARGLGRFGAEELAPLLAYLGDPLPSTALVLVASGGPVSQKLPNAVKKIGHVVDVSLRQAKDAKAWFQARLKDAPVRLDARAAKAVADHVGDDVGRLIGLLNLLEGVHGTGARVTTDEVVPYLGEAGGVAPWELTDAIDEGRTEDALTHLHRMMEGGGRHPLVIMATLHTHYTRMLRLDGAQAADEAAAAKLLGLTGSTFPARKALAQARRLGPAGVHRAISLLAGADLALKGAIDWSGELVLEVLVARLSRLAPRPRR
jgi:DNA polymerase III subunit delta